MKVCTARLTKICLVFQGKILRLYCIIYCGTKYRIRFSVISRAGFALLTADVLVGSDDVSLSNNPLAGRHLQIVVVDVNKINYLAYMNIFTLLFAYIMFIFLVVLSDNSNSEKFYWSRTSSARYSTAHVGEPL